MALDGYTDLNVSRQAMKAELLDAETEIRLARAWRDQHDERALHRLITAYMRLAISMAARFRRYGAPPLSANIRMRRRASTARRRTVSGDAACCARNSRTSSRTR